MTFKAFIDKYNNKPCDVDGMFGNQCVDLMRAYLKEVLGFSYYALPPAKYAYMVFNNMPDGGDKNFIKEYNNPKDPNQVPPQGAIMFWKPLVWGITGIGGHVDLNWQAYQGVNEFMGFDQNWPTNTLCHLQKHSYRGVIGWLRKK